MDTVYQADITTAGTGYAVNDTIVLLGGALGGTDVTHNATITVDEVDAAGAITRISRSGLADATTSNAEDNRYDDADGANVTSAAEVYGAATSSIFRGDNDLSHCYRTYFRRYACTVTFRSLIVKLLLVVGYGW